MKVLFVMKYPLNREYSIIQKLNGEMNAVRKLGNEVKFITFDDDYLYLEDGQTKEKIKSTTFGRSAFYYHTLVFRDIYAAAIKAMRKEKYDLIYFRYSPIDFMGNKMMRIASKESKLVVEIPTFPPSQEKQKSFLRRLYMSFSEKLWKKSARYVSLFTGIGKNADSYLGVPFLNIVNGIDVDLIPLRHPKKDKKIHLLAVASMANWHGYDRIIRGLANWVDPKSKDYTIDLVGGEGDGSLGEWKKLAKECGIEEQVKFHGIKTGDALTDLFETANIGLGSLGLYRNGINSASILKVREYAARGLPFIYANDDPHLPKEAMWCLKLSNDDSPIDMKVVDSFWESLSEQKGLEKTIRQYAEENMSWESQFKNVFEYLLKADNSK